MTATVCVIVPAYNAGHFIVDALKSIEAQTHEPDRVIVVDDGSTDDTGKLVAEFAATTKLNVQLVRTPNRGAAAARNTAIVLSTADLIAFLDADDVIYPTFLERASSALTQHQDWCICFSDRDVIGADGKLLHRDLSHPTFAALRKRHSSDGLVEIADPRFFETMLRGNLVPMTSVIKRSALDAVGWFNDSLRFCQDQLLMLRLIKLGGSFGYIDESLGTWRWHENNSTNPKNAIKRYQYSETVLDAVHADRVRLSLTGAEIAALHAARRQLFANWLYTASHAAAPGILALAAKAFFTAQTSVWRIAKALVCHGIAKARSRRTRD